MTPEEFAEHVLEALAGADPVVEVVAIKGPAAGTRVLVRTDRMLDGFGDTALDAEVMALARRVLEEGRPGLKELVVQGATHTFFMEPHYAPGELVIVGAGHIAQPLCRIGAMLGFRVVVLDDRPEFATVERFPDADRVLRADFGDPFRDVQITRRSHVVLVTRGHRFDYDALTDLLGRETSPAYIGMVGSRRRVRAALQQLLNTGVPVAKLREVRSPIGLDVGAETPEEIAVAIGAELVLTHRGGTGRPLRDVARVVERWIERERGSS